MKLKISLFILAIGLFVSPILKAQAQSGITVAELKKHIEYLASDSLKGRKPGTPESKLAANYIRQQLLDAGIKTLGEDGFQYFEVIVSVEPGQQSKVMVADKKAIMDSSFIIMPFSGNGSVEAEVVFAGFGMEIDQDSLQWNDYQDLDVKGKWVMVLRGDPEPDKDESLFISYGSDRDKAILAKDHEAAGILFVNGPQFGDENSLSNPTFSRVTANVGLPAINITAALANEILAAKETTIKQLEEEIIGGMKSHSFATGMNIDATAELQRIAVNTQNVVGILPGNDPLLSNEYILIGAHYDHLGFGGPGSGSRMPDTLAIHNGADDNASGVAGMLELAGQLAANKENLKRSIIFMAFGGEEMGLLGAQFFNSTPLVALKQVKTMVNLDMIGRLDSSARSIMLAGTGTAVGMDSLLSDFEKNSKLSFNHSPEGYGASDHASFYASGVPVLFFSTGAHADYHTPYDDADRINYEGEKEILDYAFQLVVELASRGEALAFQESGPKQKQARYGRGLKVKFGIMPDFTSTANDGLGVGGVTAGGPASKANMKKGDKIVAIDGKAVTNIYDYMNRLKKLKPGQTISVDIIRDGEQKVLILVL